MGNLINIEGYILASLYAEKYDLPKQTLYSQIRRGIIPEANVLQIGNSVLILDQPYERPKRGPKTKPGQNPGL